MSVLPKFADIPTRIYEYGALLLFAAGAVWWFVHYEQDIGKKEILDEVDQHIAATQKSVSKAAATDNAALDADFHVLDLAVEKYAKPIPHPANDVYADPDSVRAVNAAHKGH